MKRSRNLRSLRIAIFVSAFAILFGIIGSASDWNAVALARKPSTVRNAAAGARESLSAMNAEREPTEPAAHTLHARMPALQSIANLALAFEANEGQSDSRIKFLARESGAALQLASNRVTLQFTQAALSFRFLAANASPKITGADPLPERRNFLLGNDPAKWHTDVPTFRRVVYEQLYPGIDLTFYGNQKQIEYDFEVAPGADPRAIRLAFDRAVRPRINENGELILKSKSIELIEQKPIIYQTIDGERREIGGNYRLLRNREVGLEIGEHDQTKPLVIDPTLVYSTYLGGSGDDSGSSLAIDSSGNVYVAGTSASTNFPTHGPAFSINKGLSDIFVTKIDPAGANILYSTYIGGSGLDRADGIAIDSTANAYVVGRVGDTSIDFPTTAGALATTYRGGDFDGVLFKLNAQGNALVYSTFIGGEDNDSTEGVAVDTSGNAYITGGTRSSGFPLTASAFQSFRAGDTDAYLTKLNAAGNTVLYSTLLGGSGTDRGSGVVVDSTGNAYVAGYAASPDFPTQNAFQVFSGGSFDAFVAKIDTTATGAPSLVFSTYIGGIGDDKAFGIAADAGVANVYVAGQTS